MDEFTTYLRKEGIRQELFCQHTPQQNGVAERKNRHIVEVARATMNEKNLPKSYWLKAANTTAYLMNRCTTSTLHDVTPHEKFFGKKPDLSHIRIFGSKSKKCIVIGYLLEQKGYKCYNPSIQKARVSRDVVWDESASWYESEMTPTPTLVDPKSVE